jgi:hypothetical protein
MKQDFHTQSFDQETRHRLRVVTASPGIARAKQEAELRRRVEDWKAKRGRPGWGVLLAWGLLAAYVVAFLGSVGYILWGVR